MVSIYITPALVGKMVNGKKIYTYQEALMSKWGMVNIY
jgi:hypothetical protein